MGLSFLPRCLMDFRPLIRNGNGGQGKGLVDVAPICEGCSLFLANPNDPPPEENLPAAISQALQKWMLSMPVRVRETLPVIRGGNMIGLFVPALKE
jgi:hypothetical protein